MKYHASAVVHFSAAHQVGNDWCGGAQHGHRWEVEIEWEREGFAPVDLDQWASYRQQCLDVALELKVRDLNKMLGPHTPNVFGIAAFFQSRLSITIPVTKVTVYEQDGPQGSIES